MAVVGNADGQALGADEGHVVGKREGNRDGNLLPPGSGYAVGPFVGTHVGCLVVGSLGNAEGDTLGVLGPAVGAHWSNTGAHEAQARRPGYSVWNPAGHTVQLLWPALR